MSTRLVLATRNRGKIEEFRRILDNHPEIELVGLDVYPDMPEVDETEDSFEGNALLKARAVAAFTHCPAIADDSGLCVDALDGAPGIYSARFAGEHGNDTANNEKLLQLLSAIPDSQRSAHFVCVAAFAHPDGREFFQRAHFNGEIIQEPTGENGFGYDPLFRPMGETRTSAQMSSAEKDAISHRGQALRALAPRVIAALSY